MEVGIQVVAEDPITGEHTETNSAYAVYVAMNEHRRPAEVPELELMTDEDREMWEAGKQRQKRRLKQ